MKLRPHHLIDIVCSYGHGAAFEPHPYGHAVHTVAAQVIKDPGIEVELVLAADDICSPCRYLGPDGRCADVLSQLTDPVSKQTYNDGLDQKLFSRLGMRPGARMTVRAFLERFSAHMPGIAATCAHPGEQEKRRRTGLEQGLNKLIK